LQRQKVARKSRSGESSAPEWDPSQLTRIAHVGARMVFEAAGAKISAVRLDDEGMKVPGQSLAGSRLVYVTPGHRFPLGITNEPVSEAGVIGVGPEVWRTDL